MILAIDPGTWQSGWVLYNPGNKRHPVEAHAVEQNLDVIRMIRSTPLPGLTAIVIEDFACYGMAIGTSSIKTIKWIGHFERTVIDHRRMEPVTITRKDVKHHLCGTFKARDTNVWQAVMDRFGSDKSIAIGKKASPGPLYGITSHQRAALALAITFAETRK